MILGDSSEKGKKRLTASSGAFGKEMNKSGVPQRTPYAKTSVSFTPITKNSQFAGSAANSIFTQPMFFSPMHTPQNWQIASKRREIYQWARFYYENEPKVAAGVDFYAGFPMNGFKLECKSKQILEYYEQSVEDLELPEWVGHISHEYFLLGDVFPFLEIGCPECEGKNPKCNHPGGYFKSIRLMNPDYIEVQDNVLADQPSIAMVPDEELRMLVQRREPKKIYDKLPKELIEMVSTGKPVPLSNRSISHLKYNGSAYGVYGTSMLRRLFTVLAYKTKLMTANWIVAERLILPVRVVKVGDKDRPASEEDLSDVANQLAAVVNDPNLSIITHHAFEYDWFGASGKIHNLTNELEEIGKEILDGLMLNQSLLNGEMPGYNCHSEDTLALTDSGFKLYQDVTENDKIGCYNPITGVLEYHPYIARHEYDFDGDLIHFQTDKIDIAVTENHRMWSAKRDSDKFEFIEAKNVRRRARFIGSIDGFAGNDLASVQVGDTSIPIYQYCELAGFYVSEGCVANEKRVGRENETTTLVVYQSIDGKARKQIESLFNSIGHNYCRKDAVCKYDPELAQHFEIEYGRGSENKHLPSWLKNLSPEYLEIIIKSMIMGDGCTQHKDDRKIDNYSYYTSSEQLAKDFAEISFKCGYVSKIVKRLARGKNGHINKSGYEFNNKKDMYTVYISKGFKGKNPGLDSRSKKYVGKEIEKMTYKGKVWCFTVPYGLFVTMRNGKITVQGNSAQVGVEIMIRRVENWRNKLSKWIENKIFKPIAMMQGFVDEERTAKLGKTVYIFPTIKWNDLRLRDKTNWVQLLMQAYDKGMVSLQTVLEEMNLDYDVEIERRREETMVTSATGQAMPGGPGGGAGAPMGGGAPPGGGPPPGAEGGMPPPPPPEAGGAGGAGGAPGGDMGAGGAPGMGAAAGFGMNPGESGPPPKVMKKGKSSKEEVEPPMPRVFKLTKLEQKMKRMLETMDIPYTMFGQYEIKMPGYPQPFLLDFAYPKIGVGIETDGAIWHERPDLKERDKQRDQVLANVGWRVLRFSEQAINEHMDVIRDIVSKNVAEAARARKKAESENVLTKNASVAGFVEDNIEDFKVIREELDKGMGYRLIIGTE